MLETEVVADFGSFPINVKLDVPSGVTALVGPSGAGKSSLLRLFAGLARPLSGRIVLNNSVFFSDSDTVFVKPEKRRIGMVFQRAALVPHLDVLGNIKIGARGAKVEKDLLEKTGCRALLERPIAGLSGGEQQRVMLARALAGNPDMLLLDEPLSALDPKAKGNLLDVFAHLFPTLDIPVIYVTHAMEEAGRVAQRFALMQHGRIISEGDAAHVLSQYGGDVEHGIASLLRGRVHEIASDGLATISLGEQRAEVMAAGLELGTEIGLRLWARDVVLARNIPEGLSARNSLEGKISGIATLSSGQVEIRVHVEGQEVLAIVMARTVTEMGLEIGQPIVVVFKSASVQKFGVFEPN